MLGRLAIAAICGIGTIGCSSSKSSPPKPQAGATDAAGSAADSGIGGVRDAAAVVDDGNEREGPPPIPPVPPLEAVAGLPDPVAPPSVACRISGAWGSDQPGDLRMRPGGKPFAAFKSPKRATLSLGDSTAAFVDLASDHIRLSGFVPGDKVTLHAADAFIVAGYLAPGAGAALRASDANQDGVEIEIELPAFVKAIAPARGRVACDLLSTDDDARFLPDDAIDAEAEEDQLMLAAGIRIPVSATPGGRPVAELRYPKDDPPLIHVIGRQSPHVRVVVQVNSLDPLKHVVVFGWVPGSALREHAHGFGGSWATGGGTGARHPPITRPHRVLRCPDDVPLIAELGTDRRLVGVLVAKVEFATIHDAGSSPDDLVEIVATKAAVELSKGARFVVRRGSLDRCTEP